MKTISTYRVNTPTTIVGHSLTISTTFYGTEEEIECIKKNCESVIGTALVQEIPSPIQTKAMNMSIEELKRLWQESH